MDRYIGPPSRKSEAIATHAAPGVNGHGIHGIHGPQPNPSSFFPLPPHLFGGAGDENIQYPIFNIQYSIFIFRAFRGSGGPQ